MSGQIQARVTGLTLRDADPPGQNGRKVRAASTGAPNWLSSAASG